MKFCETGNNIVPATSQNIAINKSKAGFFQQGEKKLLSLTHIYQDDLELKLALAELYRLKKKYEDGTPFKYIVREFSKDNEEVIRRGGEIGWIPRGIFPEYDYIIFDLAPNLLSIEAQSIESPPLLYFFMISELTGLAYLYCKYAANIPRKTIK